MKKKKNKFKGALFHDRNQFSIQVRTFSMCIILHKYGILDQIYSLPLDI